MQRVAVGVATLAFAAFAACLAYPLAGPLLDNDVWWHLAHGRAYLASGPWLDTDPCLGTATRGPIPHQWLFAVAAHGLESVAGIQGLRWAHALAVIAIGVLAFLACRREVGGQEVGAGAGSAAWPLALLGTAAFLLLGWYRLVQLRPELLTLAGVLLLHRWLFAPQLPSWRQVGLAVALILVWANVHAAFLVGPLLIAAALAGVATRAGLRRALGAPGDGALERQRAGRLASALGLGLVAALANPRGVHQHLAYLESSRAEAIDFVVDEWARFDAFAHTNPSPAVSPLAWGVMDALVLAFLLVAGVAAWRLLRRPSPEALDAADPVRIALGVAGLVAAFAAIRFLWLGVLPALYLLHRARLAGGPPRVLVPASAAALLGLAVSFPLLGGLRDVTAHLPKDPVEWLTQGHTSRRFFDEGVRFLRETGVEGQLFHDYALGGYLCHELAPELRTFVDGSMNYPDDVSRDYHRLSLAEGARPGESLSAALERRGVDLFFGFGVPLGGKAVYTTAALEGHPDWRRVSRSWRHGIYLRADAANAANLERVAAWYAAQDVPFDAATGFDPGQALRERRAWSEAQGLLPETWYTSLDAAAAGGRVRADDLEAAGLGYALVGAYPEAIESDRRVARLRPRAKAPRRRLVFALLHRNRPLQALGMARELVALDPEDARSQRFLEAALAVSRAATPDARIAAIGDLPLLASRQPLRQ